MADTYKPDSWTHYEMMRATERTDREDRAIRHDLLARIASGETWLRSHLPSRKWNAAPFTNKHGTAPGTIVLNHTASFSYERSVIMINPAKRKHARHAFVLWFGSCGVTNLHVYASSLEDAIEQCAAWLADHMSGHIMMEWGEEHTALVREACEDAGLAWPIDTGDAPLGDSRYEEAQQSAEADFIRTESGFLTSYEWGIALEDPSTEELYAFLWNE